MLNSGTFYDKLKSLGMYAEASAADIVNMILTFSLVFRVPQVGVAYLFEAVNRIF